MKQAITQYAMVVMLIVGAYFLGVYKTKTDFLEKGVGSAQVAGDTAAAPTPEPIDMAKVDALFADQTNMVFGDRNAKLKFVEFSDTSCPYCHVASGDNPELAKQIDARFVPVSAGGTYVPPVKEIKKLVDEGKAAFAWFYTPGHGNGELGTLALYCANEQGKFWEAHDLLMSNAGYDLVNEQALNDRKKIGEVATFLAKVTDAGKLKSCMEGGKYEERVSGDPTIARGFGYGATPTFFINDQVIEGAASWDQGFEAIVKPLL